MTSLLRFIQASAHDTGLPAGSVQAIVTSPPYFNLRSYSGEQGIEWPSVDYAPMPGLPMLHIDAMRCGLGAESELVAYIGHLILCLREWRRILRDDGLCFVNLADSYNGSGGTGGMTAKQVTNTGSFHGGRKNDVTGLKPKDLMMVPARFALAAQADGWWLRNDIIGHKVAPMPESVTDRFTRSHEHVFMLAKSARYFSDMVAVSEQAIQPEGVTWDQRKANGEPMRRGYSQNAPSGANGHMASPSGTRNARDVFAWHPQPFSTGGDVDHFATFPESVPERFIRMATSERGCCPTCGAAWRRVVEKNNNAAGEKPQKLTSVPQPNGIRHGKGLSTLGVTEQTVYENTGFTPSCDCFGHFDAIGFEPEFDENGDETFSSATRRPRRVYVPDGQQPDPIPCVVCDPFSGSGTTAKVAARLGRIGIGVDISAVYLDTVTAARMGDGFQMEMIR